MGHTDKGTIQNWYTADGQKVKSKIIDNTSSDPPKITNYISTAEYENSILQFIAVEEGRVVWEEDGTKYPEYFLKDHLGNTRARIADKNGDNLVYIDQNNPEEDELMNIRHYYPFGMEWDMPLKDMAGNSLAESELKNKYTYNGKELVSDLDIDLHDYGFRYYDPAIARFTTIDPLAEDYDFQSGYAYAVNNPILHRDIMGLGVEDDYKLLQDGTIELIRETDDENDQLFATDLDGELNGKSIEVEKGVLQEFKENEKSQTDLEGNKFSSTNVTGDDAATELFEFAAENTLVEFGLVRSGENDNTITTTHKSGTEGGGNKVAYDIISAGGKIREKTHSHPTDGAPSPADINSAKYWKGQNGSTIYKIYKTISKTYTELDKDGKIK